jgi:hypothetical protein
MIFNTLSSELSQFVTAMTQLAFVLAVMFFFASRFLQKSAPFVAEREQIRPLVGTTCAPIVLMRAEVEKMKAHTRLLEADLREIEAMHADAEVVTAKEAIYYANFAQSFKRVHERHLESDEEEYMHIVDGLNTRMHWTMHQLSITERAVRERAIRTTLHDLHRSQNRLILQEEVEVDNRLLLNSFIIEDRKKHNMNRVLAASRIALTAHEARLTAQLAEQPVQH